MLLNLILLPFVDVIVVGAHELGHYLAARLLGVAAQPGWLWLRVRGRRVGVAPCVRVRSVELAGRPLADAVIALNGPAVSILVGAMLAAAPGPDVLWGMGVGSILLGLGALTPGYPGSDGRRLLGALLVLRRPAVPAL